MRYVNRTPKLRDNADCAIWQAVANLNWKNYKMDVFDNGIPKENCRLFVNVSGPFVHLMFKSQSKNALAQDETLMRELKLCLEAIGRKVRAFQNKKLTREKTQKRSSLLEKHVHPFVQAIFTIASSDGAYAGKIKLSDLEDKLMAAIGEKKVKAAEVGPEGPTGPSIGEQMQARSEQAKLVKPKVEAVAAEPTEITVISSASSKAAAPTAAVAARPATPSQTGVVTPAGGVAVPKSAAPGAAVAVKGPAAPPAGVKKPGPEKPLIGPKPGGVPGVKPAPAKVAPTAAPAKVAPKVGAPAPAATSPMRKPAVGSGAPAPVVVKRPAPAPAPKVGAPQAATTKPVVQRPGGGPAVGKPAVIDERSILASIGSQPMDIRDIITKMGITDMSDARYLQIQLRTLETSDKLIVEIKQGKKLYRKK